MDLYAKLESYYVKYFREKLKYERIYFDAHIINSFRNITNWAKDRNETFGFKTRTSKQWLIFFLQIQMKFFKKNDKKGKFCESFFFFFFYSSHSSTTNHNIFPLFFFPIFLDNVRMSDVDFFRFFFLFSSWKCSKSKELFLTILKFELRSFSCSIFFLSFKFFLYVWYVHAPKQITWRIFDESWIRWISEDREYTS